MAKRAQFLMMMISSSNEMLVNRRFLQVFEGTVCRRGRLGSDYNIGTILIRLFGMIRISSQISPRQGGRILTYI